MSYGAGDFIAGALCGAILTITMMSSCMTFPNKDIRGFGITGGQCYPNMTCDPGNQCIQVGTETKKTICVKESK